MSVLFIFRRDLRIMDNLALNEAIEYAQNNNLNMILAFTFTNEQTAKNQYFSENSFQFMIESLMELNKNVNNKLSFFEDKYFYEKLDDIKAICFNKDYTPYAINRDNEIVQYCKDNDIKVITAEDYTLLPLNLVKTVDNKSYKVFTPFYNKCLEHYKQIKPSYTRRLNKDIIVEKGELNNLDKFAKYNNDHLNVHGGRTHALTKFKHIKKGVHDNYKIKRDIPSHPNSTTELSAYLKFGCVSIRETYYLIKSVYGLRTELIKQLFWKEFYAYITYHYPRVLDGMINESNKTFNEQYNDIKWKNNDDRFERWCKGDTGFPLVDAGMRQMNETGYMHNRLRMITASFLIKDLHIDWRRGEKYFASKLVDYDPASNNGGWQWVAGTGTDASPYFRIFNPWTQIKRFDNECKYIKEWVDELKYVDINVIKKWNKVYKQHTDIKYSIPIVDHDVVKKSVVHYYK